MMHRFGAVLLAGMAATAAAQDLDFRYRAPIAGPEGHSHYRLRLTPGVYAGAERPDLGDLRVLNALGEPVPYAFLPRESTAPPPAHMAPARFFPLYGREGQGVEGVKLDVVRGAGGTVIRLEESGRTSGRRKLLGYLVDVGNDERIIEALELDWRTAAGFNGTAQVEASADLVHWRTLARGAPILELAHAGETLERRRIELRARAVRYLRLSFAGVPGDFALRGLQLEWRGERAEGEREWKRLVAVEATKAGEYRFDAQGRYPADRMRLHLPQQNTVARVQVFSRDSEDRPWRRRTSATVYRLQRNGATVTNPDLPVSPGTDREWLVRADLRGGGLGAGSVSLELGWIPHELVFAARGAAPFALAFGNQRARPETLAPGSVLPGYETSTEPDAQRATLGPVATVRAPVGFLSDPAGWTRAALGGGGIRTWLLWLVLGAGVIAVAWMALRLQRDLGREPRQGKDG